MPYDEYARWRDSPDCGHMTGTAGSGPQVCGRSAKFAIAASCPYNVTLRACGTHANKARRDGYSATPLARES